VRSCSARAGPEPSTTRSTGPPMSTHCPPLTPRSIALPARRAGEAGRPGLTRAAVRRRRLSSCPAGGAASPCVVGCGSGTRQRRVLPGSWPRSPPEPAAWRPARAWRRLPPGDVVGVAGTAHGQVTGLRHEAVHGGLLPPLVGELLPAPFAHRPRLPLSLLHRSSSASARAAWRRWRAAPSGLSGVAVSVCSPVRTRRRHTAASAPCSVSCSRVVKTSGTAWLRRGPAARRGAGAPGGRFTRRRASGPGPARPRSGRRPG
jgi:hypothetical protein